MATKQFDRLSPIWRERKPLFMYASKISEVEVNRFRSAYQEVRYSHDQPE